MDRNYYNHYKLNLPTDEPTDVGYRVNDNTATGEQFHFHNGLEIIQIWSDDGLVLVEDSVYPMHKGRIYFFNAQDIHCTVPTDDSHYVRNKLTFSPLFMSGILKEMDQLFLLDIFSGNRKKITRYIDPTEEYMQKFDELFRNITLECREKRISYTTIVRAYLLEMLVLIHREISRVEKSISLATSSSYNHILNILDYINRHLTEGISFDALSSEIHLSRYHICHLFKKYTGMTLNQYIINRRISKAKKLLLTRKPVSEIALETGFSSFSLFTRTFKKITGTTPRTYRKISEISTENI